MNKLTEVEKAYLAGIMDGDGCIHVNRKTLFLQVSVSQCDKYFLEFLQEKIGLGKVNLHAKAGTFTYKRDSYVWQINGKEAGILLETLCKYLVLKQDQAKIALEFQKMRTPGRHRVSETTRWRQRAIAEQLSKMKRESPFHGIDYSQMNLDDLEINGVHQPQLL